LLVSLLLAVLSFHFIEDPVRHSRWLQPRYTARERGRRYFQPAVAPRPARLAATAAAAGLLSAALVAVALDTTLAPTALPAAADQPAVHVPVPSASAGPSPAPLDPGRDPDPLPPHTAALRAALASTQWPDLSPDPAAFTAGGGSAKPEEWVVDGCLGGNEAKDPDPVVNAGGCVYGNPEASRDMVLFGDSVAMAYLPALRAALNPDEWRIHVFTAAGCTPAVVAQTRIGGAPYPECPRFRDWAVQRIGELHPEVLVLASFRYDPALVSGATGDAADAEWQQGTRQVHDQLAGKAGRTLVLAAPPEAKDPAQCATRFSTPADCETALPATHSVRNGFESRAAAEGNPAVQWVDTTPWFCVDGRCPSFVGSVPLYADAYHLSAAGSASLSPLLGRALAAAPGSRP